MTKKPTSFSRESVVCSEEEFLQTQDSGLQSQKVPSSLRIVCDDASSINLQAAEAAEEGKPALRKFSMVAYTGGAMRLGGWPYPVVVDLAGMRVTRKSRPILKDHDRGSIFGHTDGITVNESSRMRLSWWMITHYVFFEKVVSARRPQRKKIHLPGPCKSKSPERLHLVRRLSDCIRSRSQVDYLADFPRMTMSPPAARL